MRAGTRPGNPERPNEDAIVVHANCHIYGVIDGVSAMGGDSGANGRSGGYIAARLLADGLQASEPEDGLMQAVLRANDRLRQQMAEAGVDLAYKWKLWGAVFAVCKVYETFVDFVQCGDCMLFARYKDGTVRVLTRNQVAPFDWGTLQEKQRLTAAAATGEEVGRHITRMAETNRSLANTLAGYSVMNGDPAFGQFVEYGRISRANLVRLYALSDGMFHFIEHADDPHKWEQLLARLDDWGIDNEMDHLTGLEDQDPLCTQYPRHKKSDDKSVVIVDF
ncbi:protein phosphatase 2C domain-containing protein [Paenibacillus riograndensis]|uniref:protein phosphatase 2C domain-containing protein n=1 Tax=Paenibacillus riograndensis TaxID=483937 RepID=UPI001E3007D4|nr:protein phosphatase 2C domain-containing protein [Paenibacillus riograndensis]